MKGGDEVTGSVRQLALLAARAAEEERRRREEEERRRKEEEQRELEFARRDAARRALVLHLEPIASVLGIGLRAVDFWTDTELPVFQYLEAQLGDLTFRVSGPELIELHVGDCQKCGSAVFSPVKLSPITTSEPVKLGWVTGDNLARIGRVLMSFEKSPFCNLCVPTVYAAPASE
jgi:hypothetical protein